MKTIQHRVEADRATPVGTARAGRSDRWQALATYVAVLAAGLAVWWALSQWVFPSILWASPATTWNTFVELATSGRLTSHMIHSIGRILAGFTLGTVVAIPLGLGIGTSVMIRRVIEPYVEFLRFIPPIAFLPLAILWLGIGEGSKVFLIFYGSLFQILINTIAGVYGVDPVRKRAARCLGIDGFQLFRLIILPSAVPFIVTGMRVGMGNSFMTLVSAEMLAAEAGLGFMIFNARLFYRTGEIFVGLITLGVMGFLTDRLFRRLSGRLFKRYGVRHDVVER